MRSIRVDRYGVAFSSCLFLALGLAWLGCTPLTTAPVTSQVGTTTTIIIVRHAEKLDDSLDPPLNDEGVARATALADVLQGNGVTAIYCPDLLRNRQTCDDVEQALGLTANVIAQVRLADTKALANELVDDILDLHAGGVVLFVGNTGPAIEGVQSGNLQELYARLGGTGTPPVKYQDLYVVIIPEEGDVHFIEATYGGRSSLD